MQKKKEGKKERKKERMVLYLRKEATLYSGLQCMFHGTDFSLTASWISSNVTQLIQLQKCDS